MSMSNVNESYYSDCTVLITGGSGSIGLDLARALLKLNVRQLRIFSNDENGLFEARQILGPNSNIEYLLGDVRDTGATERATQGCEMVFHAAALKHVGLAHWNPFEAIHTNVIGTQNLITSAAKNKVSRFVFISTDKAVNPATTMGATKLLGERLTTSASSECETTIFCSVRFGNVLGSRGSVIRIWERQLNTGKPITITDPSMTRFIMLPTDCAALVLNAGQTARTGEIHVLKMHAVRIGELAKACLDFFAKLNYLDSSRLQSEVIGAGPEEKSHEELMTLYEAGRVIEHENFFVIPPISESVSPITLSSNHTSEYRSDQVHLLSQGEIASLLSRLDLQSHARTVVTGVLRDEAKQMGSPASPIQ